MDEPDILIGMRLVRLRLKVAVQLLILAILVGVGVFALLLPLMLRRSPETITLPRLEERQRALDERDAQATVELVIDYASFIDQVGDLQRAHEGTVHMLDANPRFASSPEIVEKRRVMDEKMAETMQLFGIDPATGWQRLLDDGLSLSDRVLARTDLDRDQRGAAGMARGQILYQSGRYDEALKQADEAAQHGGNSVLAHLLRGDIYVEKRQYDPAIEQYRAASLALTTWANEAPPLSVRLAMSGLAGPMRAGRHERRQREQRQHAAAGLRQVIADQISVIRGLQQIEQKQRPN